MSEPWGGGVLSPLGLPLSSFLRGHHLIKHSLRHSFRFLISKHFTWRRPAREPCRWLLVTWQEQWKCRKSLSTRTSQRVLIISKRWQSQDLQGFPPLGVGRATHSSVSVSFYGCVITRKTGIKAEGWARNHIMLSH